MCDVLVLEANDLVREFLVEVLESEGFEVEAVQTPQEALSLMEAVPACRMLVIDIDSGVDGLNGFEVGRQARSTCMTLPVLYFSGLPSHWNDRHFDPFEDFISKPFELDAFLVKVRGLGVAPRARSDAR
jgi:DNA-binding response OmpR family regulator